MIADILPTEPRPPHLTLGMGSVGRKSTFLEHGHVAYHIKWNHESSNVIAHFLPADPPTEPWGWGQ